MFQNLMEIKKPDTSYLYICFAAFWCYCLFASVIDPPFLAYYTYDETFIADSGVFLWFGVTPRILDWPASPSVLIYGVIFGLSALYQVLTHLSEISGVLDAFVVVDKTAYEYLFNREPYILAGRVVQLLIVLVVGLWTIRFVARQQHPLLTDQRRLLVLVVLVSSAVLWNSAPVLRPEAISQVFFVHILARLLFSERLQRSDVRLISILFGLVIAERLIFFILSPLFFAGVFLLTGSSRWKELRASIGFFSLSFLAFCPFVFTDPLIIAKAFFGGIMAKVNDNPMGSLFNWEFIGTYFDNPVSYLALGLAFLGVVRLWKQQQLFYRIVLANWLLFLFLVLRSSKIYDPHVMPAALINLFVVGIGLATLSTLRFRYSRYATGLAVVLILAGEAVRVVSYHTWARREGNGANAVNWIKSTLPANASVATNIDIGLHLPANGDALDRWITATDSPDNQLKKLRYLVGFNPASSGEFTEETMSLSASAFAFEDEEMFLLQYRLLKKYGKEEARKRFDLDIFIEDNTLFYHGILLPDALDRFRSGHYDYWITDGVLEGLQPVKEFAGASGPPVKVYKSGPGAR